TGSAAGGWYKVTRGVLSANAMPFSLRATSIRRQASLRTSNWCLHLAAKHLDPWIDAVELGLEWHVDDLGEFRLFQHLEPDLFHQFSDALAVDGHRHRSAARRSCRPRF